MTITYYFIQSVAILYKFVNEMVLVFGINIQNGSSIQNILVHQHFFLFISFIYSPAYWFFMHLHLLL